MSTALYRRYRPETFAEVIGQEHVTGPLMQALRTGRVNHAYLFSGPRGCGKTTSARILARTLNCHRNTPENPTDTPCGECPSCVDLARGGPGSLDVVEIDAASHGGVDDARELRERATFAPSRDRYKVFIIDEAHMVSSAGFNALLKIVEEPPAHVRFVFATTEPDKVIGTIRSRTHHYPFRLVPPDVLTPYLDGLCRTEGVEVGSGVLPLVVRAGGGSVRDTLSVLDQLIAGSAQRGETRVLDYEQAIELLGYTHASLLDDVVDAVAARDGASLFRVVERVVSTGHEPRRFVEDVLERFRDLIVLAVSDGEAVAALGDLPTDQLTRMRAQASALGVGELSRAADLTNAALTEMTGATSPRLHLELLCARLLLPGADDGAAGFGARLDRLERGWAGGSVAAGSVPAAAPAGVERPAGGRPVVAGPAVEPVVAARPAVEPPVAVPPADRPPVADERPDVAEPRVAEVPGAVEPPAVAEPAARALRVVGHDDAPTDVSVPAPAPAPAPASAPVAAGGATSNVVQVESELVRRRWDEVLATLFRLNKSAWSLVKQNATVAGLDGSTLTLSFQSSGLQRALQGPKLEAVEKAVYETLGFAARVNAVVGAPSVGAARSRDEHHAPTASTDEPDVPSDQASPTSSAAEAPGTAAATAPRVGADPVVPAPVSVAGPVVDAASAGAVETVVSRVPVSEPVPEIDAADAAWLAGAPTPLPAADRSPSSPSTPPMPSTPPVSSAAQVAPAAPADAPTGEPVLPAYTDDDIPPAEPPDDDLPPWDDVPEPVPASPALAASPVPAAAPAARTPASTSAAPASTPVAPTRAQHPLPEVPAAQRAFAQREPRSGQDRRPGQPSNLVGAPLVAQLLGGTVIDEIIDAPQ